VIAKGNMHNNGAKLAKYMISAGEDNEKAELYQLRGFAEDNIVDAFRTVQGIAAGTHCEQPFFHVQVRTPVGETLTRAQWEHVADRIEAKVGLSGQPRAIAFHLKEGHEHMHVAWSRIDDVAMKAIPLPFFKERLKEVCRELEAELGLKPVRNHREPGELQAPTRDEYEQARRLGQDAKAIRSEIREAWDRSDSGKAFVAALEDQGLILAKGERRDYLVIDREGGMHALGKRILGVSAVQVRERLSDLDRDKLPTVDQARERQAVRGANHDREAADRQWQNRVNEAAIAKPSAEDRAQQSAIDEVRPAAGTEEKAAPVQHAESRTETGTKRESLAHQRMAQWQKRAEAERARVEPSPVKAGLAVVDGATGVISKLAEFLENLFTGGSGPPPREPAQDPVERIIEQRRAADALKRIGKSLARGEALAASDIRSLTRDQLENIQARGDDGLRRMVEQMDRDRQRERDGGRSRER
jgi:hypothetical protein